MNIDDDNCKSFSPCKVRSKYFTSKLAMDESLSDFQETKKSCTGPKNPLKATVKLNKAKQVTKQIRGQRDIRTALKSKKNELESYTKAFDNICKLSGIDVDSEQLQLAITLSKSLQQTECASNSSQLLKSQNRTGRIRTTLQEYGFKIPEIKIKNKRLKNHRKQHKLLLTSHSEKLQVIADKYSQVLFENLDSTKINNELDVNWADVLLYHLTTNANYDVLKDNQVFYISNLVEKSTSSGTLLRDWAEIPGRPISPKFSQSFSMNFSEIECSQEELDVILSGTIKNVKNILTKKQIEHSSSIATADILKPKFAERLTENRMPKSIEIDLTVKNGEELEVQPTATQYRSCSPDIFDDEEGSGMIDKTDTNCTSQDLDHKVVRDTKNDSMDLTECFNSKNVVNKDPIFDSNKYTHCGNITKRKSNDFMEITDCVASSSQPVHVNYNIDLSNSDNSRKAFGLEDRNVGADNNKTKLDVTPPLHSNELFNNVDLTESLNNIEEKHIMYIDLSQSSSSSDDLPFININYNSQNSLDNTITINVNEYEGVTVKLNSSTVENKENEIFDLTGEICTSPQKINSINKINNLCNKNNISEEEILDLTGEIRTNPEKLESNPTKNKALNDRSFEEYVHNHSDSSKEYDVEIICDDFSSKNKSNSDIDLTQTTNSSNEESQTSAVNLVTHGILDSENEFESPQKFNNNSRLGKRNEISIDYDQVPDNFDIKYSSSLKDAIHSSNSVVYDITDENNTENHLDNGPLSNSGQNSEIFQISDKELDYSLHKSKLDIACDNFMFGGISILDNFSNVPNINKSTNIENHSNAANNLGTSLNDSVMPVVETNNKIDDGNKSAQINPCTTEASTPQRTNEVTICQNTPRNCEYIVKTDEVTPMADYASMSSPERNRELDKYGLKPFKRKRAIQLLTHIYNQTHPIMEPYLNEDPPSPSKRRKQDNHTPHVAPKWLKSPKKTERTYKEVSPKKCYNYMLQQSTQHTEVRREIGYEVTNEVPDIKDIDCGADDWVFLKRERAKVYTCRLPLHIAFHNYVSCRRGLREAILRYEPINIDVIHKDLVAYGQRYDPKDLLKFMDKKCITVKTTDNDSKDGKR